MWISLKTALAMIKRRKGQSVAVGLILSLTSLLFFVGMSLLQTSEPFEHMYERAKGSHTLIYLNHNLHDQDEVFHWWEKKQEVEHVNVISHSENVKIAVEKNGRTEMDYFFLAEYDPNMEYDLLITYDLEKPKALEKDEIYINPVFSQQYNVTEGDSLDVLMNGQVERLTVAGVVIDPQYSSLLSFSRNWVGQGFLDDYEIEQGAILGIRYETYDSQVESDLMEAFEADFSEGLPVQFIPFETIKVIYSLLFTVISAVLLLVSILMLVISIFIIRNTIAYSIIDHYKSIGVMKATGYSNRNIVGTYLIMFGLLTIIGSLIGMIFGYFLQGFIAEKLQETINVPVSSDFVVPSITTMVVLFISVMLFSFTTAKKGANIKPVQAIKYGIPENKVGISKLSIKKLRILPLPMLLATKQLMTKGKQSAAMIASHSLIIVLCICMISISDTFKGERIIEHFTSMPTGDMTVSYQGEQSAEEFLSNLKTWDAVGYVFYQKQLIDSSLYSIESEKQVPVVGTMLLGHTEEFGVTLLEGRVPSSRHEIAVSTKTLDEIGKELGDYVELTTAAGTETYLVTGIYQTVNNLGLTYIIPYVEELAQFEPNSLSGYTVAFADQTIEFDAVKEALISEYGDKIDVKRLDDISEGIKGLLDQLPSIFTLLLLVFYIASGAAVMNWTMMDMKRSAKMFGLLKASGLSNRELMGMMITKTLFITIVSALVGFGVALVAAPSILEWVILITPFQITRLTIDLSMSSIVITLGLYLVITIISTFLPARIVQKITPRVLIIE